MPEPTLFDRSVKILFRDTPDALCRLLGMAAPGGELRFEDVSVNVPELRADKLFVIGTKDTPLEQGRYVEFQLEPPSRETMGGWFAKAGNLNYQRPYPVALSVIYLTRGRYKRFPSTYTIHPGPTENKFTFHTIRLWKHADRIRHGDLQALAPLLVLCENRPNEETLQEEKAIIRKLNVDPKLRDELLVLSIMVGRRYFAEDILYAVFGEEIPMIKELSFVEEWISEGEARGKAAGERGLVVEALSGKYGELPLALRQRIDRADTDWCRRVLARAMSANSLEELDLS